MAEKVPKLQRFRSEEEFAQTWDRCITDMIVKMGGGLGLGIVFSVFLFGRRGWPIYFGMGSGFGIAYNNCQSAFSGAFQSHQLKQRCSPRIQLAKKRPEKPEDTCRGSPTPVCTDQSPPKARPSEMTSHREEPWTAHNSIGQVTDYGYYDAAHPHYNLVGLLQQTIPQCPPNPPCEATCSADPRDSCRFKTRM